MDDINIPDYLKAIGIIEYQQSVISSLNEDVKCLRNETHNKGRIIEMSLEIRAKNDERIEQLRTDYNSICDLLKGETDRLNSLKCCGNCDRDPAFSHCVMDCSRQEANDSGTDLWEEIKYD